jgi:hypothetical protein
VNVNLKVCPGDREPESKLAGSPSSDVTVWFVRPLGSYVQQTVSPFAIDTSFGVNWKSVMLIMWSPALQPPAGRFGDECPAAGSTSSRANSTSVENPLPIPIRAKISHCPPRSRSRGRNVRGGP